MLRRFGRYLASLAASSRTRDSDRHLGVILAFIAGAVNAGGFLAVGRYTSHMTGIVSSVGTGLVTHDGELAEMCALFLACFIGGAVVSSLVVNYARLRHYDSEYAPALMLEAVLLMLFSLTAEGIINHAHIIYPTLEELCFIMGLQNAIITKISGRAIRTTHVTGISTDIGVEIGRALYNRVRPEVAVDYYRLRLNVYLLIAFFTGGFAGALSFTHVGFVSSIPLAILLIIIAAAPSAGKR